MPSLFTTRAPESTRPRPSWRSCALVLLGCQPRGAARPHLPLLAAPSWASRSPFLGVKVNLVAGLGRARCISTSRSFTVCEMSTLGGGQSSMRPDLDVFLTAPNG